MVGPPFWADEKPEQPTATPALGVANEDAQWRVSDETLAELAVKEAWRNITNPLDKTPLYYTADSTSYTFRMDDWLDASFRNTFDLAEPSDHGEQDSSPRPDASQASSATHAGGWDRLVQQQALEDEPCEREVDITLLPPPGLCRFHDRRKDYKPSQQADVRKEHSAAAMHRQDPEQAHNGRGRGRRRHRGGRGKHPKLEHADGQPSSAPKSPPVRGTPLHDAVAEMPWVQVWEPPPAVPEAPAWPRVERSDDDCWIAADEPMAQPAPLEHNMFLEEGYWSSA